MSRKLAEGGGACIGRSRVPSTLRCKEKRGNFVVGSRRENALVILALAFEFLVLACSRDGCVGARPRRPTATCSSRALHTHCLQPVLDLVSNLFDGIGGACWRRIRPCDGARQRHQHCNKSTQHTTGLPHRLKCGRRRSNY